MAGSPFKGQGGAATATAAPTAKKAAASAPTEGEGEELKSSKAANPADLPDATGAGADDPYNAADPGGMSGFKPGHFMDQLVLCNFYETGRMKTVNSGNEPDGKSPYCKLDLIPLTLPDEFGFTNKHGEYEACDEFEVGERLEELMFFNKPLVREAERALRKGIPWVLGRITKGERKPNQDAPVILRAATDEDKALYAEWRASKGR